jgi:hypothetical protein
LVRKEGNAAAAASIASWTSAVSNSGAVPINLPEDGSTFPSGQSNALPLNCQAIPVTSNVLPDFAFTHSPLTYATFVFNRDGSLSFGTLCDIVEAGLVDKEGRVKA